jgi:hypothetical protein
MKLQQSVKAIWKHYAHHQERPGQPDIYHQTFLECESPYFYTNKETLTPVTPGFLPPISLLSLSDYSFTETVPESEKEKQQEAVEALNDFLKARDISPIRQCLR